MGNTEPHSQDGRLSVSTSHLLVTNYRAWLLALCALRIRVKVGPKTERLQYDGDREVRHS